MYICVQWSVYEISCLYFFTYYYCFKILPKLIYFTHMYIYIYALCLSVINQLYKLTTRRMSCFHYSSFYACTHEWVSQTNDCVFSRHLISQVSELSPYIHITNMAITASEAAQRQDHCLVIELNRFYGTKRRNRQRFQVLCSN